ncbi:MAG: endolytic transglycosylase MltG [Gemmatimonadales bacterium]|nr:MAG: endolytic transglycosylase MltG [Gemmatimonadales bacterium]
MAPCVVALIAGCATPPSDPALERVTIPPGASVRIVADSLRAHGVVESSAWLRFLSRLRLSERLLKAGIYDLPRDLGAWNAISALRAGRVATTRFTAPEGLSLLDLAALVESRLGLDADSLMVAARESPWLAELEVGREDLEGFLQPETYTLPLPVTARSLVNAMAAEFGRSWKPEWDRRLDSLGLSRAELVTLASIVEAEARQPEERPIIAGVYHNRRRRGMLLQADPTVQYAIQRATGQRKNRLYFKDLDVVSPYNTYQRAGLPPGPINAPGRESLEAALYPAEVPWLYFVAGPDGRHIFSRTLTEHNRAIAQLRRRGAR